MKKLFRHWKIIYALGTVVYMGWIIQVGDTEFDRVNSQYRRIVARLEPDRIRDQAVEELTAECIRESQWQRDFECSFRPPAEVEAREKAIAERLLLVRQRGLTKVVLFYTGFACLFVLGPPALLFLMLLGAVRIYKSVKFVRDPMEKPQ